LRLPNSPDWVSEFAPRKQQRFLSYIVGWLAALGWQALIATTAYIMQNWHQSLVMILIGIIGTLMNTVGARFLPILEIVVLIFTVFGFFCIIIPLWVLAPKAPASEVFGSFENLGGWSSMGTACFVGSITATGSFAGSDAAAHLAEETRDASRTVVSSACQSVDA
jgi:choline transport protein